MLYYKSCRASSRKEVNSMDNIILSSFLGLTVVAIYDNYYYIHSAVYGMLLVINNALQASIGNSIAKESVEKNFEDLNKFTFIMMWMVGFCAICMLCLYQPFMDIWMHGNKSMFLSTLDMFLMCFYFYIINMNNTRNLYINGKGLFWECRYYFIIEAISNLFMNVILGKLLGVTGVILATIITIFLFNFIARSNILFNHYFKRSPRNFYIDHTIYFSVTCLVGLITYTACSIFNTSGFFALLQRMGICIILPNIIFLLCYCKTKQFENSLNFLKRAFKR